MSCLNSAARHRVLRQYGDFDQATAVCRERRHRPRRSCPAPKPDDRQRPGPSPPGWQQALASEMRTATRRRRRRQCQRPGRHRPSADLGRDKAPTEPMIIIPRRARLSTPGALGDQFTDRGDDEKGVDAVMIVRMTASKKLMMPPRRGFAHASNNTDLVVDQRVAGEYEEEKQSLENVTLSEMPIDGCATLHRYR